MRTLLLLLPLALLSNACSGDNADEDSASSDGGSDGADGADGTDEPVAFALTSSAFEQDGTIPTPHECGPPVVEGPGDNLTPPLSWTPGPEGTASYALVMRDLDFAPDGYPDGLLHWVVYDIPADALSLDEGLEARRELDDPAGARQAELQNSGYFGYLGPCSPSSVNTYQFTLHAMGEAALEPEDTSEITVAAEIEATSLASVTLSGES